MERITEEQAAAIAANAPSRQVRRALQRKVDKHNRQVDQQEEMLVRRHRVTTLKRTRRQTMQRTAPEPKVKYPAGEDQRADKYLHAGARIGRAMRTAGMGQ
jgi:hypothetical protein